MRYDKVWDGLRNYRPREKLLAERQGVLNRKKPITTVKINVYDFKKCRQSKRLSKRLREKKSPMFYNDENKQRMISHTSNKDYYICTLFNFCRVF